MGQNGAESRWGEVPWDWGGCRQIETLKVEWNPDRQRQRGECMGKGCTAGSPGKAPTKGFAEGWGPTEKRVH